VVADPAGTPAHPDKDVRKMGDHDDSIANGEGELPVMNSNRHQSSQRKPDTTSVRCYFNTTGLPVNRLIIPFRRILLGRRTRVAGMKRRDSEESPLQPETTLI
jgi:hypothetical protein